MENKTYASLRSIDETDPSNEDPPVQYSSGGSNRVTVWLLSLVCLILTISNTVLVFKRAHDNCAPILGPQYSGIEQTSQLQPLFWTTKYSEFNNTGADNLWKALRPAIGNVALDHSWASEHGLPKSQDFEGDKSKGLYVIDAYHQIHCLQQLRFSIQEMVAGIPQSTPFEHKFHCLDSLRQSVMCRADDTPLYTLGDFRSGDGQLRKCRDWKMLAKWVEERFPF